MVRLRFVRAFVAFVFSLVVFAQSEPAHAAGGGEVVSVTFNPLRLFVPVFEAAAEVRLMPALGVAGIGGIGSVKIQGAHFTVTEVGGQIVAYPLGDFRSLQLGGEVLWLHINGNKADISAAAAGIAVGPFVGYKLITRGGFTFSVQGGGQYVIAQAQATDAQGNSATGSASGFGLLLNLNFGWSF